MLAAVDSMRRAASYSPPKDITLQDGKVLKGCRILEVSDGSISVEHSEGLQRLTITSAPAEWVDRFALAWTATTPAAAPSAAPSVAPAGPEILPALAGTASVVQPVERVSSEALASLDSGINQKREAIASWLKRYASAWNAADYYSQQASNAAWKHYIARYRGKISAHTAVAQENLTHAREARVVAQDALIRIDRLRSELSELIGRRNSLSRQPSSP
jgi:hypothetical protein